MKKHSNRFAVAFSLFALLLVAVASTGAQIIGDEVRPFDFADKYYEENGVIASALVDRKTGSDGQSVFDSTNDPRFGEVRITATLPAYTGDGGIAFWNYYGGAHNESFFDNAYGENAIQQAYQNPMYVFPSSSVRDSDRQAALIKAADPNLPNNPLGLAAVYVVEFTEKIHTPRGRKAVQLLAERNGLSLDGTPIVRTTRELESLYADALVNITIAGSDRPGRTPFVVAKVLDANKAGAIVGDAFLIYVQQSNGEPLDAESPILSKFKCMQSGAICP